MSLAIFQSEEFIFFTTQHYCQTENVSLSAGASRLSRLEKKEAITRITRGVWANTHHPYFSPLGAPLLLIGNDQGYISFLTALHYHGVISQIPTSIQVATTGITRSVNSPVGNFDFFQLNPVMMKRGIEWSLIPCSYRMATAEKALIDTLYLSTRKGRRFAALPELEIGKSFKEKTCIQLINEQILDPRIKSAVLKRLESVFVITQHTKNSRKIPRQRKVPPAKFQDGGK